MGRFRLSRPARADLASILATSAARWGIEGRRRYASLLAAAMREVASNPEGALTRERDNLHIGVRSFHIRHVRIEKPEDKVQSPVHVLYFRVKAPGLIEIVAVLHERMEPGRHLGRIR